MKKIFYATLLMIFLIALISRNGNQVLLRSFAEAPGSLPNQTSFTPIPHTLPPATEAPATEEATSSPEPIFTEEMATEPYVITEPAASQEPGDPTENSAENTPDFQVIIPAEGFWAVSSPDGSIVLAMRTDWIDNYTPSMSNILSSEEERSTLMTKAFIEFVSPDENAFVYLYSCIKEGTTHWDAETALTALLDILNHAHTNGAHDINMLHRESLDNNVEKVTWVSEACNCSGTTLYKTGPPAPYKTDQDERLWIVTAVAFNPYQDDFQFIFDYMFETLTFPPEESRLEV